MGKTYGANLQQLIDAGVPVTLDELEREVAVHAIGRCIARIDIVMRQISGPAKLDLIRARGEAVDSHKLLNSQLQDIRRRRRSCLAATEKNAPTTAATAVRANDQSPLQS